MSFDCEHSCSSALRVSNFNSNIPQRSIYPHIKLERDPSNIFLMLTSSGSTGGGYAKTLIIQVYQLIVSVVHCICK